MDGYLGKSDMWKSNLQAIPWWASSSSYIETKIYYGAVIDCYSAYRVALV